MNELATAAIHALCQKGASLSTAESLTGGGIGAALTAVPGSSQAYWGGVISYTDDVKANVLDVPREYLTKLGAVSAPVAEAMAQGARKKLKTDIALSVTGLAGPGGDDFGNPVGTVFIGYCDEKTCFSRKFCFSGSREAVRTQTCAQALRILLEMLNGKA